MDPLLQSGSKTDIGKIRDNNEDSFYINDKFGIYIVADGIGGYKGGEIASKIATEYLGERISEKLRDSNSLDILSPRYSVAILLAISPPLYPPIPSATI